LLLILIFLATSQSSDVSTNTKISATLCPCMYLMCQYIIEIVILNSLPYAKHLFYFCALILSLSPSLSRTPTFSNIPFLHTNQLFFSLQPQFCFSQLVSPFAFDLISKGTQIFSCVVLLAVCNFLSAVSSFMPAYLGN